jgi:hypothetical protein
MDSKKYESNQPVKGEERNLVFYSCTVIVGSVMTNLYSNTNKRLAHDKTHADITLGEMIDNGFSDNFGPLWGRERVSPLSHVLDSVHQQAGINRKLGFQRIRQDLFFTTIGC